jgi:5-oxopent-3-ene-1,2,5-tricarboxylate decarboxylase/2-hydroxyhepta-2,4-diene-1,7-dioate isomerase
VSVPVRPFALSGIVYGALLNHRPALDALGDAVNQAPYKAPPVAPVLYQKPRNTLAAHGAAIVVPVGDDGVRELELGASMGIVISRTACRISVETALDHVAGYLAVADLCLPHDSFYRPSLRFRARDGFCPLGPAVTPREQIANPDALGVQVFIDDQLVQQTTTGDRIRGVAQLLADITDFMTLSPGDVVLLGVAHGAPRVKPGQQSRIEIDGLAPLANRYVAGEGAR